MLPPHRKMRLLLTAIALTTLTLIATRPALADSYQVSFVAMTQSEGFYGIDANGDFVVNLTGDIFVNPCGGGPCFETFYLGQSSPVVSTLAPTLNYDDGSPCTPILSTGMSSYRTVCNNGREIFGGEYDPPVPDPSLPNHGVIRGVWTGPNLTADYLGTESFDGGFINSKGDAVFIDGLDNTLVSAFDLTTASTPEPSGLILLGTGCLAMLRALRRSTRG